MQRLNKTRQLTQCEHSRIREFSKVIVINSAQQDKYLWIHDVLTKFRYFRLSNANRSIIKKYLWKPPITHEYN